MSSPPSFEQEHVRILVFGKASRHNRAGGAEPMDDLVIVRPQVGRRAAWLPRWHEFVNGIAEASG